MNSKDLRKSIINDFITIVENNNIFDYKIDSNFLRISVLIEDLDIIFVCFIKDIKNRYKKRRYNFIISMSEINNTFNKILSLKVIKDTKIHTTLLYVFGYKITEIINKKNINGILLSAGIFNNKYGSYHFFNYNEKIIEDYLKEKVNRDKTFSKIEKEHKLKKYYLGSIWYPSIYFSDVKTSLNVIKVIEHKIGKLSIIIDSYGCIFVGLFEPPLNRITKDALNIINILLALANLNGIEASLISNDEVVGITDDYYKGGTSMGYFPSKIQTIRGKYIPDIASNPFKKYGTRSAMKINNIKTNQIIKLLPQFDKALNNDAIKSYLNFYLESKTKFIYKDYKSSFLTGWIILEKYIEEIWMKYIKDNKFSSKRRKKLTNNLMWSMDYIIESLNMSKIINDDEYKDFMKYKRIRNNIVHEGKSSDITQTKEILILIDSIMKKHLNSL